MSTEGSGGQDLARRVAGLEEEVRRLQDAAKRSHFGFFHFPIDYENATFPPDFPPPILLESESLPVPPPAMRAGYATDDTAHYLNWGRYDHDLILSIARRHIDLQSGVRILDFGCSSGRVLRHFHREGRELGWSLYGVDPWGPTIEWMRRNFPPDIYVCTTNHVVPSLPFEDNFFDIIYGISVFTHFKYLWDAWLSELRRCLKPGGLCLQSVHLEHAWSVFAQGGAEWQIDGVPEYVRAHPVMDVDYLLFTKEKEGTSNVFLRKSIAEEFYGRYFSILEIVDPPEFSFQHWMVMSKPEGRSKRDLAGQRQRRRPDVGER